MSDSNPKKSELELNQARAFLESASMSFISLERGSDPPDVFVRLDEEQSLFIEITEYHPEDDRVGIQKRWQDLSDLLFHMLGNYETLYGVTLGFTFIDQRIPRRSVHLGIAEEVVRFGLQVRELGLWGRGLEFYFEHLNHGRRFMNLDGSGLQWTFHRTDWPYLAAHTKQVTFECYENVPFPLVPECWHAQVAWCSPRADALRDILDEKNAHILKAIKRGAWNQQGPLWLLVVANRMNDMSSFAFGDEAGLQSAIEQCGFDFESSCFDRVWMLEECGHGRCRPLYPWGPATHYRLPPWAEDNNT